MEMRRPILCADNWFVLGAEKDLTPAYTVASWDEQDAGKYAEFTSNRSEEQVESLDSAAELIKSFIETETEMETGMKIRKRTASTDDPWNLLPEFATFPTRSRGIQIFWNEEKTSARIVGEAEINLLVVLYEKLIGLDWDPNDPDPGLPEVLEYDTDYPIHFSTTSENVKLMITQSDSTEYYTGNATLNVPSGTDFSIVLSIARDVPVDAVIHISMPNQNSVKEIGETTDWEALDVVDSEMEVAKTLHFPKVFGFMTYHENENEGWYVFCGENDENDSNAWTREEYASLISGPLLDAQYEGAYSQSDVMYVAFVNFLRSLMTTGSTNPRVPYMKLVPVYMNRWGIYGKDGELITGVAYHTLEEAAATVLRICDFCGDYLWDMYKDGVTRLNHTAIAGYAIAGDAIVGTEFSTETARLTITNISCTYNQSGTVYNTDPLDSLKDDLTVVATYSDNTTATLESHNYVLDGTLKIGTSMITVICGGQQNTFRVNVTADENSATSVSCTFDEDASIVYSNDSLDSLRSYLRVTATYPEGSTKVINNYTLSGTLSPGDSTVTVSYGGQTTYFKVYVVPEGSIVRKYRLSNGTLMPLVNGNGTSLIGNGILVINSYGSGVRKIISVDSGVMPYNQRSGSSGTGTPSTLYPIPVLSTATKARITVKPETLQVGGVIYKYANNAYSAVTGWSVRSGSLEINFSSEDSLYLMGQVRRSNDTQITETIEEVTVMFM